MRLRRPDWLGELQGLAALVGVVAAVAAVMRGVVLFTGSDGVPVELWARRLDGVALGGGIAAEAAESIGATALIGTVPDAEGGFYAELTLPIGWVMLGLGFLAVGELIRRGCALRDELAGVI